MCHAPTKPEKGNICIYCGSKNHSSGRCTSRPNDNREEPRSTPRDLQESRRQVTQVTKSVFPIRTRILISKQGLMMRYNRQYSPNYNNFQPSPLGSILGLDLSATLIELANIQSRYLDMMAVSQMKPT